MFVKLPVLLHRIPSKTAVLLLTLLLSAPVAAQTTVSNTATVAPPSGVTDPVPGNNSATDTDTVVRQGDLGVTKTDSPDPVAAGGLLTYTITLSNAGPSALRVADSLTVLESLPAGLAGCSFTPSAGTFTVGTIAPGTANGSGQWTGLALASGGSATLTIACTVSAGSFQSGDVIANTVTVQPPTGFTDGNTGNNTASTTTTVQAPQLTLTKTASATSFTAGVPASYMLSVQNTGAGATSAAVTITDPIPTGLAVGTPLPSGCSLASGTVACTVASGLAPNASASFVIPVTPVSDLVATSLTNTATASGGGDSACPAAARCGSTVTTPVAHSADLAVVKTVSTTTPGIGANVTFTIAVNNGGPSAAAAVVVNDPLPAGYTYVSSSASVGTYDAGSGAWTVGSLATGAGATLQVTARVNETGPYANTATVASTTPDPDTGNNTSTVTTTPVASPSLAVVKSAAAPVGNTIAYSFVVTNTGNVTLTGIVINDAQLASAAVCPVTTLAPGVSTTCTGSHSISQAELDAGVVNNSATASGTPPTGGAITSAPSTTSTPLVASPSLTVVKSAGPPSGSSVGSTIAYSFLVTNTGNVTLSGIVVNDSRLAVAPTCAVTTLAPGVSTTCSGSYAITQADLNAGVVNNSATASGTPPTGGAITSAPSTTSTTLAAVPALTLDKGTTTASYAAVGDTIAYSYRVANTGNQSLAGPVTVADDKVAVSCPAVGTVGNLDSLLDPGEALTCTATYSVVQADIIAGSVTNVASAAAAGTTSPTDTVTVAMTAIPALSLSKTASPASVTAAGDVVTYSFTLRNTGNTALTGVSISDPLPGLSSISYSWPGVAGELAVGQSATASATYTVTQADINGQGGGDGRIDNTATAGSTQGASATASAQVALPAAAPALTLDKSTTSTSFTAVGDTLAYSYVVTNAGNVSLTGPVVVSDDKTTVSCPAVGTVGNLDNELDPGESLTCTASYSVVQADILAGRVTNVASAVVDGTTSPTDTVTVAMTSAPALTLSKTAGTLPAVPVVGTVLAYNFALRNSGNVALSGVSISDALPGLSSISYSWPGAAGELAVGQSATATATYTLTATDFGNGQVVNSATATGTPPSGPAVTTPPSTTTTALVPTIVALDDSYTVPASGGTTASVVVNDTTNGQPAVIGTNVSLVPGTVTTPPTAGAIVMNADGTIRVDAGTTAGTYLVPYRICTLPGTTPATCADAQATVVVSAAPGLSLSKTASPASVTAAGDVVTYSFTLRNTGNTALTGVSISDPLPGLSSISYNWPGVAGELAVGQSATASATYTVTQADINSQGGGDGRIDNTATAGSTQGASATASAQVALPAAASALTIVKSASLPSGSTVGSTIAYSFLVTNTGNVTLSGIVVDDSRLSVAPTCLVTTLAPGVSTTCSGSYAITQADLNAGVVNNSATASGTPPTGPAITSAPSTTTTPLAANPSLTVVKSAGAPSGNAAGSTIAYSFLVTNTGNVTLGAIAITDARLDATATCPVTTLAPGARTTCAGTHTITQAELDAGVVNNSATAEGMPPGGPAITSPPSTTSTPLVAVRVAKSADPANGTTVQPGQTVAYTLSVRVLNSATTAPVVLTDTLSPDLTLAAGLPAGCVAAGNGLTCTVPAGSAPGDYAFTYTATVNADATGSVSNNVVASGTDNPACTACTTTHPVAATVVTVSKQSDPASGATVLPGATINYTLTATVAVSATTGPVLLTDSLTGDQSLAGALPTGCVATGTGLACTLPAGSLPGTYTFHYATTVGAYARGQVGNAVVPSGVDNPTCAGCTTSHPVAAPVVGVAKTSVPASGTSVVPGATIAYTLTVTVADAPTTAPVTLADTLSGSQNLLGLPAGCVAAAQGLACTLPAQSAPGTYRFEYSATVATDATGAVGNSVVASGKDGSDCAAGCVTGHPVVADFELRMLKSVAVGEVGIGDLVRYTLTVENVGSHDFVGGAILDTPPAGFSYVEGSLAARDGDNAATVSGQHPIRIEGVDIAAGKSATFVYLLRVGAGVRAGAHANSAQAFTGGGESVSNVSTATVTLVSDPLLDDSLVLGTVFDDADGDGWQDSAALDGVKVQGGFAPSAYIANSTTLDRGDGPQPQADASSPLLHGLAIGAIGARQSVADPVAARQVVVRQHLSSLDFTDDFVLTSAQGVTVRMDAAGNTRVERVGEAAAGRNGAQPTVERRVAQGEGGYVVDYVIGNAGIDERGVPGVRIASVEGLLVETDQFGRFHLAGIDAGMLARGRNFILKVDPATLPPGTVFTTANPLVRRITPGVPVRFDFGARLPAQVLPGTSREIELELGKVLFAPGSAALQDRFLPAVEKMAEAIREYHGGEVVIAADGETQGLAFERAQAVRTALLARLPADQAAALTVSVRADPADPGSLLTGLDGNGPVLGTVLFDTDRAELKPGHEALLERIAAYLEKQGGGVVAIVGHADPRGSYAYNDALGLRRAKAVFDALASRLSPEVRAKLRVETVKDPAAPAGSGK